MTASGFLEINTYLKSTFLSLNIVTYIQKNDVCIGSCPAPLLSDLFLAECDIMRQTRNDLKISQNFSLC